MDVDSHITDGYENDALLNKMAAKNPPYFNVGDRFIHVDYFGRLTKTGTVKSLLDGEYQQREFWSRRLYNYKVQYDNEPEEYFLPLCNHNMTHQLTADQHPSY